MAARSIFVADTSRRDTPEGERCRMPTAIKTRTLRRSAAAVVLAIVSSLASAQQPVYGGTLTVGNLNDCLQVDTHKATDRACRTMLGRHVYSGLVKFNETMEIVPDLAESWTTSDDGTVWTFKIREGVLFHDGSELTLDDIVFSFERIMDPETGSAYARYFESVVDIRATEDHEIVVELGEPFAPFLAGLANPYVNIVSKTVAEANDLSEVVIGTGPFRLVERVRDQRQVLVKFEDYFIADRPYLDRIVFLTMPDESARAAALQVGEVDFIDTVQAAIVRSLQNHPDFKVVGGSTGNWRWLMFHLDHGVLQDPLVRRAIAHAIDRDEIVLAAVEGMGEALYSGPIPTFHWATLPQACASYDPGLARQLLSDAGYPNGFPITLTTASTFPYMVASSLVIQSNLQALGIDVTLETIDWAVMVTRMVAGEFDMVMSGFSANVDPHDYFTRSYHSTARAYSNGPGDPVADQLIDAGARATDQAQRQQFYWQLQERLCELPTVVPLYSGGEFELMTADLNGYAFLADGQHVFVDAWLDR